MPHVTFIHGILNKPPKDVLLANWQAYLLQGGLDLAAEGVTTSMVYWADMLYPKPEAVNANFEAVEAGLGAAEADDDLSWTDDLPEDEKTFVESFRNKLGFDAKPPAEGDFEPPVAQPMSGQGDEPEYTFEAIPLPWPLKKLVMKTFLKDVHHYLFNAAYSPRPGEQYQIQTDIRKRFINQLKQDTLGGNGPHVVVSHSMGTVISYDCLKNVPGCPGIDGYMTVGSPLGISEVYDNFKPPYKASNAFPSEKLSGNWINVYDRLDPVALDARIANDYMKNGQQVITDQRVYNPGRWKHSSYKYFAQKLLCDHLRNLLGIPG